MTDFEGPMRTAVVKISGVQPRGCDVHYDRVTAYCYKYWLNNIVMSRGFRIFACPGERIMSSRHSIALPEMFGKETSGHNIYDGLWWKLCDSGFLLERAELWTTRLLKGYNVQWDNLNIVQCWGRILSWVVRSIEVYWNLVQEMEKPREDRLSQRLMIINWLQLPLESKHIKFTAYDVDYSFYVLID